MSYVKMDTPTAFILVSLFVSVSSHVVNYCGSKMCEYTDAHTFCQFQPAPSSDCTTYIPSPLTQEEKSRILARLNRRREEAAGGRLRGLSSAANMLKLRWVGELASEAQLWADQCRPPRNPEEHDVCRDLYSITVGQCVASVIGEAPGLRVESMVDIWFMQSILYKGNETMYEPPEPSQKFYGDFAQMMSAPTYMVGCGRSRFMVTFRGRLRSIERLVCNFAPQGPIAYRPLWMPGAPASACPARSRPHNVFTSLCDYQHEIKESNDVDNSIPLEDHVLLNAVLQTEGNDTQQGTIDEIYLTYLAIVTMQASDSTSMHYNSMQKRDIVEKNYIEDERTNKRPFGFEKSLSTIDYQTTKAMKTPKKKLGIIGRHKSYNLEELSDTGGDKDEYHRITEKLSKHKKDFYDEYNIHDYRVEENETTTIEQIDSGKIALEATTLEDHSFVTLPFDMMMMTNGTFVLTGHSEVVIKNEQTFAEATEVYLNATSVVTNESLVIKDKTMDDYLSDPETVRQLQEALDRMERDGSLNASERSGKSRRDLRPLNDLALVNTLTPDGTSILPIAEVELVTTLSPEEERNQTLERGPMLNMVMKYMPYLKTYEKELIGTTSSAAGVYPSVLLMFIILCV